MIDKMFRVAGVGLAVGVTLVIFGPPLFRAARPLIRQAVKTAVIGYAQGREAVAHLKETVEDAYAEAVSELVAEAVAAEGEAAGANTANSQTSVNG